MRNTSFIQNRAKLAASAAPLALGVALIAAPTAASAQETETVPPPATTATTNAPIIVTGTRIMRPDLESVSPLTVVGAEEIAATGTTRTEDLINSLPQVVAGQTAFVSNGASGTGTINLRNLGTIRTLVLIDGRRVQPGDPFVVTADINQIPAALVERIEVVTGGASATYGADAVAGVVNFIMDRDFEGIRADAQMSFYQHDNSDDEIQDLLTRTGNPSPQGTPVDGFGYDFNVVMGAGFDDGRGHVTGYLGYRQIDELTQASRDYSACALAISAADPTGYTCAGSSTTPNGTFYVTQFGPGGDVLGSGGVLTLDEDGPGNTFRPSAAFSGTGADTYNFAPTNYFQRPDKRWTAGFFAEYEISPSVIPYAEFQFMDDRSVAQIAFSGTFFTTQYTLSCDHPLLSDQQATALGCTAPTDTASLYIGKRLVEGLPRQNDLRHTSNRAVLGVRGSLSPNWSYDAYIQRGNTIYQNTYLNDLSVNRIDNAIASVVDGPNGPQCSVDLDQGCVPLNLFEIGGVTQEQFDYIAIPGLQNSDIEQYVASAFLTGTMANPLGTSAPIGIVIGAEYRKEQYELRVDQNFLEGTLAGQGGPTLPTAGEYSVREVFGELRLPLLEWGVGGALELVGGYRLSDYTTAGTTHTYKGGVELAPIDGVRFRGIYNRAVRAPNIVELFAPQGLGLFGGTDPCSGATPTATLAQCQLTGVTAAQYGNISANPAGQYNQITGGNPNLDVEKADSYTAGVVIEGSAFGAPGFIATVDYFNIEVTDTISGLGAQNILNSCISSGDPAFCDLINRAPTTGSLWLGTAGFVVNTQQNIGGLKTDGIDFQVGYRFPLGAGSLSADLTGTYYFASETQTDPSQTFYDCIGLYGQVCGTPQPEYRHRASLGYRADSGWGATLRWRHFGGVDIERTSDHPQLTGATGNNNDSLPSYDWFDISASYDFTDNFRVTAGVNNIFDRDPPLVAGADCIAGFCNGNVFAGVYDPVGRYVFVGGRVQF